MKIPNFSGTEKVKILLEPSLYGPSYTTGDIQHSGKKKDKDKAKKNKCRVSTNGSEKMWYDRSIKSFFFFFFLHKDYNTSLFKLDIFFTSDVYANHCPSSVIGWPIY